jgi:hypothetical protein
VKVFVHPEKDSLEAVAMPLTAMASHAQEEP